MAFTGERKRQYQRDWVAARRALWFSGKTCYDCGALEGLELHHVDPAIKVSHRIWSWSWKRITEETSKCVTLCEPCHAKITVTQQDGHVPWEIVLLIRKRYYQEGRSGMAIAADLGLGQSYVYRVINGEARKSW